MKLDYQTVENFANAYVDLQRQAIGDRFATECEMMFIHSDIFGWLELWQDGLSLAIGATVNKYTLNVDHNRKTIEISL